MKTEQTFYDGTEESWSDGANVGKVRGLEFLFEVDYKRQQGNEYLDQHHFIRFVDDKYILKGEYLEDGFADIKYFETSQRYRYKVNDKLSFNAGLAQRLSEPYGYDPLAEWMLSNGNIHYTYLALQEGYNVNVAASEYFLLMENSLLQAKRFGKRLLYQLCWLIILKENVMN